MDFVVVPFKGNAKVIFARPICFHWITVFDGLFEMISIFFSNIFDSKIVNDEGECDWAGLLFVYAYVLSRQMNCSPPVFSHNMHAKHVISLMPFFGTSYCLSVIFIS